MASQGWSLEDTARTAPIWNANWLASGLARAVPIDRTPTLPDPTNVTSGQEILTGIAFHQHQVGAQTWSDAPTIIQAKRAGRHRRGGGERFERGEAGLGQELHFAMQAGAMCGSRHGCIGPRQNRHAGGCELAQRRFGHTIACSMGVRPTGRRGVGSQESYVAWCDEAIAAIESFAAEGQTRRARESDRSEVSPSGGA